ncbi:MAG: hypothetical protein A2Y62_01100 [Candidatus Fischerbacteria bacterium RBG_13_37_8]|uniref:TonB-dependent receptor n=1 Tax=Candidatus Fischerbacteria bacterium RBG_13_37_8 TaxID=1817863 RepID=A0A1F5VTG7_9BACT|nr:MAG: hypothetical protein A2Y62_01100 [Candidatus Fischerbacteria bacterium RBG_13_37_8]
MKCECQQAPIELTRRTLFNMLVVNFVMSRNIFHSLILLIYILYGVNFLICSPKQDNASTEGQPQALNIRGKIENAEKKPVEKAIIIIPELNKTTESDSSGAFEITQLTVGVIHMEIYKDGYVAYQSEALTLSEDINLAITLIKKLEEEIVVTATRTQIPLKEVPIRTELINAVEIEESGEKTVYDILNTRALGLWVQQSCTNCNFTELRMQGLEGGYSQVLIDGQPIFTGLASVYGLQQIRSENIQQIEIVKGSSSALYGSQAIAGVVNIITKEPTPEPEANMSVSYGNYNSYDLSAFISLRKDIIGFAASAQKAQSDYVDENGDNFTDKVESDTLNLSLKSNLYFAKDMHRASFFIRYIDEFRRGGYVSTIDDAYALLSEHISTGRYEFGAGYQGIFKNSNILKINAIGTHHKRWASNASRPFESEENTKLLDIQYTHTLTGGKHRLTSGFTYNEEKINEVIDFRVQPEKGADTYGVYLQDEIESWDKFTVVGGIRYDYTKSPYIKASAFSPRIGLRWEARPELTMRASVGRGFKVPYLFSENLHLCSCAPLIYNPGTLKPESSLSFNLSGEYSTNDLVFEVNVFRTTIDKKIYFTKKGAPPGYDFVFVNGSGAYTQGIEAQGNIKLTETMKLGLGFTYADAQYKEEQDYEVGISKKIMRNPQFTGLFTIEYNNSMHGIKAEFIGHMTGSMYIENYVEQRIDHTPSYFICDTNIQKELFNGHVIPSIGIYNILNYVQEIRYTPLDEHGATYIYAPLTGRYLYGMVRLRY